MSYIFLKNSMEKSKFKTQENLTDICQEYVRWTFLNKKDSTKVRPTKNSFQSRKG